VTSSPRRRGSSDFGAFDDAGFPRSRERRLSPGRRESRVWPQDPFKSFGRYAPTTAASRLPKRNRCRVGRGFPDCDELEESALGLYTE